MKKENMKIWMVLGMIWFPIFVLGADTGLDDGITMVAQTGKLFGVIIVVITVSLWMLPIAFAGLVYSGQKKKAEQMHEEVGLKASILALLAGILGAAMSYYVVGTIGIYSLPNYSKDATLKQGNTYLLKSVIGTAAEDMNAT